MNVDRQTLRRHAARVHASGRGAPVYAALARSRRAERSRSISPIPGRRWPTGSAISYSAPIRSIRYRVESVGTVRRARLVAVQGPPVRQSRFGAGHGDGAVAVSGGVAGPAGRTNLGRRYDDVRLAVALPDFELPGVGGDRALRALRRHLHAPAGVGDRVRPAHDASQRFPRLQRRHSSRPAGWAGIGDRDRRVRRLVRALPVREREIRACGIHVQRRHGAPDAVLAQRIEYRAWCRTN